MIARRHHVLNLLLMTGAAGGAFGGFTGSNVLLGNELEGFALDFLDDSSSMRTLSAYDLIASEAQGFALDYITNTSAMKVS